MQYIEIVFEDLTLFWGMKWVEEDNCGTNNIPTKILIEGTDVIPDIICRSTTCKPFIKVLEMQLISWTIDNTWELVVDTGIGHILQLKKHTNIATKHISLAKSFGTHSQSQPNCQGTSKTGSIHDVQVPAELWHIYKGSLKGNGSLLNAWVEVL